MTKVEAAVVQWHELALTGPGVTATTTVVRRHAMTCRTRSRGAASPPHSEGLLPR